MEVQEPTTYVRRPRLTLLRAEQRGSRLALVLAAQWDGHTREVMVLLSWRRGGAHIQFPHVETDGGESLGPEADEEVRDFVRRFVAHHDAQEQWRRHIEGAHEEWR